MSSQIKLLIQKPLTLFISTTCPFCINANRSAVSKGIKPEVIELNRTDEGVEIRKCSADMTKQTTVPYVFSKGEFIGGFSESSQKDEKFWNSSKKIE